MVSRRYEILQRFMEGVRNGDLRRNLATMYAHEHYLNDPPTVEALRYATQQYLRTRGPSRDGAQNNWQNRQQFQPAMPPPRVLPQPMNAPAPAAPVQQPAAFLRSCATTGPGGETSFSTSESIQRSTMLYLPTTGSLCEGLPQQETGPSASSCAPTSASEPSFASPIPAVLCSSK